MTAICYFIAAPWGDSAIPQHFQALSRELVSRGHRVVYLPHGTPVRQKEGNFHIYSFPSARPTRLRDFTFLHQLVRDYKPDCMIANFGAVNVMTIVGWLKQVPCRVNWYHTPSHALTLDNGVSDKTKYLKFRKRLVLMLATHVVANSLHACEDAVNTYRIPRNRMKVLYNTLANPKIAVQNKNYDLVTCVGRFDPTKGQDVLI